MITECVERNGSGYVDPTVDHIIKNEWNAKEIAREDYKFRHMSKDIKKLLEDNGYILDGPICLINTESGRRKKIY